jgi:hypothetical protein
MPPDQLRYFQNLLNSATTGQAKRKVYAQYAVAAGIMPENSEIELNRLMDKLPSEMNQDEKTILIQIITGITQG